MAKRAVKTKDKTSTKTKKTNKEDFLNDVYATVLDEIEKDYDLAGSDAGQHRLSTGSLVLDLILGGGLAAGMTTLSGLEASAKSTITLEAMGFAARSRVPVIAHFDAEGTATNDINYAAACMRVKSLKDIYGEKIGEVWRSKPKVRYWDTNIMEKFFDSLVQLLNRIPDKIYKRDRNQWFLRIPRDGKSAKKMAPFLKIGEPDPKLSNKHYLWIPTNNPYPQALIVPDSYVTFMPEGIDEKEEASNALAEQAREYAKHLRRVVGKFKRKQIVVLGANQLRERPGPSFGNPIYEPSGNALKHFSSARCSLSSRATPKEWRNKTGSSQSMSEPSVEGNGKDTYAFKHIRNTKNKNGTPFLEGWIRIWVRDKNGRGRGLDTVYDTAQFLIELGLAKEQKKSKHALQFAKFDLLPLSGKVLTWQEFKTLIVAEEYRTPVAVEEASKIINRHKIKGIVNIRSTCFKLARDGTALNMMAERVAAIVDKKEKDDDLEA